MINSPIGAVFFVSGAITVLVLLGIIIMKKGTELHSILGYLFFFGLCFANYAATVSYFEGYLPLAAISITVPVSTLSLFLGLASIIPKSKSQLRIRIHIISSCISATSVFVGIMINWYHFNVMPLDIFRWDTHSIVVIFSIPILIVGGIITFYFLLQSKAYFDHLTKHQQTNSSDNVLETEANENLATRTHTILVDNADKGENPKQIGLRSNS